MRVEKDFKEFIALLNRFNAHYLIIGGFAYSFYAEPRYTKDIDILTSIKGVDFKNFWPNRVSGKYGDISVFFISKQDLICCKRLSGRKQDLADIENLEKI